MNDQHEHPGGEMPHRHNDTDELAAHGTGQRMDSGDGRETLQLREEELRARKESVETGRVSIGKDIVSEQRTIDVPVTREEVMIERHPVSRQPSDGPIGESTGTIDVPVYEEQIELQKRAVVYEEVGVDKRNVQETQRVSGEVRREEARIERDDNVERRRDA